MARRRANSPDRSRRRRHDESSDSDGYFQAPLVVKPLASPLRESAAYNSPDTKEYKHASRAEPRPPSSSESSSSGSDDDSEEESESSSGSESESSSESGSDDASSDSSSKSGTKSSNGERDAERQTNGRSKTSRDSPGGAVKRKSSRNRSESPDRKKPKERSKRSASPDRRKKSSPVQRRALSPARRKSPPRERRNSPRRDTERRRSVERRRSPRKERSPRRSSPRRDSQNRRRDSPKPRRSPPRDQRAKNDRRDRRSSRGRDSESRRASDSRREVDSRRDSDSRRENDSRRDGDSRRENASKRDRVKVKTEKLSPDSKKGNREARSPELSKWADDQDRRTENRRPRDSDRPRNRQDRLGEMKRRNKEMEAAEKDCVWGKKEAKKEEEVKPEEKQKPNLGLSGKLAEDTNVFNGVVVKYNEPSEAKKPKRRWRLYVFKGDDVLPFIPLHRQSAYLLGRDRRVADIPVDHPSCSKQHAVLQYRSVPYQRADGSKGRRVRPYVLDMDSANGTFVNGKKIEGSRYVELFERDVIKFGFSSREYVLIPEDAAEMTEEPNDQLTTAENGGT